MESRDMTDMRAVVLYQPPKRGLLQRLGCVFRRISFGLDRLFLQRRRVYLQAMLLLCLGMLIGSYYATRCAVCLKPDVLLRISDVLIPAMFIFGMTLFGVVCVPLCVLCVSFACGCCVDLSILSSAQGVLFHGLLLLLLTVFLLFSAEAFLSSERSLKGWKALFHCRSYLAFLGLFLLTFLLEKSAFALWVSLV